MNIQPTEQEIQYVRESLNQYNNRCVGEDGHTPLHVVEYASAGFWVEPIGDGCT